MMCNPVGERNPFLGVQILKKFSVLKCRLEVHSKLTFLQYIFLIIFISILSIHKRNKK